MNLNWQKVEAERPGRSDVMAWGRAVVLEPDQWWESGDKNKIRLD